MTFARTLLLLAVALPLGALAQESKPDLSSPPLPTEEEQTQTPAPPQQEAPPPRPVRRAGPKPPAPLGTFSLIGHKEEATVLARGELVVGQTVHGIGQAVMVCLWAGCQTVQQTAGALLLGGLAGGGGSYLLTMGGISGGPALAMNNGAAWGFAEGALALLAFPQTGSNSAGFLSLTTLLGFGSGLALGGFLHPTGGQVAMTTSGGIWTGVLLALFSSPALASFSAQSFFTMELIAVNAGMLGFGFLSTRLDYSRGRMFLIDVGGVIGGLVGAAAFLIAGVPAVQGSWMGPTVGVGALAGLAGTVLLTQGIDNPTVAPAELSLMPFGPEGLPGVSMGARF